MLDKLKFYATAAAAVALLTLYVTTCVNKNAVISDKDKQITRLGAEYDSLAQAKQETIIEYDTIVKVVRQKIYLTKAVDSVKIYEIIEGRQVGDMDEGDFATEPTIYRKVYDNVFETEDFSLPYRISLWGDLEDISFESYTLYDKTVTEQHIVKVPVYEKKRSHLYLTCGFNTNFQKGLNGGGVGFDYIHKKGWGLGAQYQNINALQPRSERHFLIFDVKLKLL